VIEHWTEREFCAFLQIVTPFLAEQGFVRIAIPDGFHPDPVYINYVKPGGSGAGASDHKVLYTYVSVAQLLSKVDYDYQFLEYFDETGQFHQIAWEIEDGFVHRSANYDSRNKNQPLTYTSLIFDVWPKIRR
jgi:predicted SAM-dependent methyltransferase